MIRSVLLSTGVILMVYKARSLTPTEAPCLVSCQSTKRRFDPLSEEVILVGLTANAETYIHTYIHTYIPDVRSDGTLCTVADIYVPVVVGCVSAGGSVTDHQVIPPDSLQLTAYNLQLTLLHTLPRARQKMSW